MLAAQTGQSPELGNNKSRSCVISCHPSDNVQKGGRKTVGRLQPLFGDGKAAAFPAITWKGMTLDSEDVARCALQGFLDSPGILVADTALCGDFCYGSAKRPICTQICPVSLMSHSEFC